MFQRKKIIRLVVFLFVILALLFLILIRIQKGTETPDSPADNTAQNSKTSEPINDAEPLPGTTEATSEPTLIDASGMTLETRIHTPSGYERTTANQNSLAYFLRNYRMQVSDSGTHWAKTASPDDSYETFQKYMRIVFAYAGTLSMKAESKKTSLSKLKAGDIFIKDGSPGHVVMVVDLCKNKEGKKAFLLAQGYMPAQDFHVLKNPSHETDPWYYEEEVIYPFATPEYTFEEGRLRRLTY